MPESPIWKRLFPRIFPSFVSLSLSIYSWVIGAHIYIHTHSNTHTHRPLLRVIFEIKMLLLSWCALPSCHQSLLLSYTKESKTLQKKKYISQMPICLMARTFMTRHFLNGLFRLALFCLLFFSVGKWWTKGTTFWKQKKRTEILIGLMFFNDFIDRVLCAFRTVTANILLRSFHTWSKGKSLFSV